MVVISSSRACSFLPKVLQQYNVLSDKNVKEPVRVVAVNESMSSTASGPGTGAGVTMVPEGAVGVE